MSKLYILSFPFASHADIITREELVFVRTFIEEYCKGSPAIYTALDIIYAVDATTLAGLHMSAIVAYCERNNIAHKFQTVTI